jgi:hypothetical protein
MVVYILCQVMQSFSLTFKILASCFYIFVLYMTPMNLKRLLLFKVYVLTKRAQFRIYAVHDEAKDKAFELELSWICEESKRQHQKVLWIFT